MRNSNKRQAKCGLCMTFGHTLKSCVFMKDSDSEVLGSKRDSIRNFIVGLGNPTVHLVLKPQTAEKILLQTWMEKPAGVPKTAKHLHITRCFYSALAASSHSQNVPEVNVLQDGVLPMIGSSPGYFPVEMIKEWISTKTKINHVLTSLGQADPQAAQNLYTCGPSRVFQLKVY